MLLRITDPARGLYNGIRMIVVRIGSYILQARLTNKPDGPLELIPRFMFSTQEGELPFVLTRKQFPIRLCFAMTINKSQGQTLKCVGIDLRRSSFMHGQLYVALSRVTSLSGISALLPESSNTTNNAVCPELLLH
ncbi:hypothetical protein RMATCC62417_14314 [Rhizopus microsporus]|nr:hypothetical protein RMATCC62417_14314 [Rhizopus microsporus]